MKREIKFRLWHKPSGVMVTWKFFCKLLSGEYIAVSKQNPQYLKDRDIPTKAITCFEVKGNPFIEFPDCIMQFTGLHDKNGKEIYEGDIIALERDLSPEGEKEYIKVYYNSGAFLVNCDFGEGDMAPIGWALEDWGAGGDKAEVVGNIYENPELIDTK